VTALDRERPNGSCASDMTPAKSNLPSTVELTLRRSGPMAPPLSGRKYGASIRVKQFQVDILIG
jgi:hypothetical protein